MNKDSSESNFDRQQKLREEEEAFLLKKKERRLKIRQRDSSFAWTLNSTYVLIIFLQILLTLRFFLRLMGANTQNQFTQFIYGISDVFVAPFSTLFISPVTEDSANPIGEGNIFDLNVLVAIVVYALLCWLGVILIKYFYARR
ncbi:YggT family protein [Cyanobacterium aponinum UTEX 3221]|uniref:YggT family protein n=1 Tax=Cyanobacterium aponinum TaxID=379064 RepID=UPI002B4BE767|nr:YggT family protein [Cyanobacterium aponinum]WRL39083.1 YggT family protein [Cyanobacterium aponinum UTEX 3221]